MHPLITYDIILTKLDFNLHYLKVVLEGLIIINFNFSQMHIPAASIILIIIYFTVIIAKNPLVVF